MGGMSARFTNNLYHYSCLKFIGQYTKDQQLFEKIIQLLKSMPSKIEGYILSPLDTLFMMKYNRHCKCESLNNIPKPYCKKISKTFRGSIFVPEPEQDIQINEFIFIYGKEENRISLENINTDIAKFLLSESIVNTSNETIEIQNDNVRTILEKKYNTNFEDGTINAITLMILEFVSEKFDNYYDKNQDELLKRVQEKVREEMIFLDKTTTYDFTDQGHVEIVITDEIFQNPIKTFDQMLLLERFYFLFNSGLFEMNSQTTFYYLECGFRYGRLWMVKYLIDEKKIQMGGWDYKSMQTNLEKDIQKFEKETNHYSSSLTYDTALYNSRKNCLSYAVETNLFKL